MENAGDLTGRPAWEPSPRHPRMPVADRAKIFMPFAALRGFDDEIDRRQHRLVPRPVPGETETEALDAALRQAAAALAAGQRPRVLAVVFQEEKPGWGDLREVEGILRRVDPARGLLLLEEESLPVSMLVSLTLSDAQPDFLPEDD